MDYLIIIILIFFSAIFSGLNIGLLGLDKSELKRKIKLGNKKAKKIFSLRKDGHLLLVVLLLGNVIINSILAVFLGDKFIGPLAVLFSTILIVIFGEIIPQSIFYKDALRFGYRFIPFVKFFTYILYPVAWPLARVLDKVLGKEKETIWSKREIKEIIKSHEDSSESDLDRDEEKIILGALSFSDKLTKEIMTPKSDIYFMEENTILTKKKLKEIKDRGFTRIPVFDESHDGVVGVLNAKSLINFRAGQNVSKVIQKDKIFKVLDDTKLDTLLNKFISKKSHIAYVTDKHNTILGIVSLENVIEEILNKEIIDESDK